MSTAPFRDQSPGPAPQPDATDSTLRSLRGFAPLVWFLGLAAGAALSWKPLLEHIDYLASAADVDGRAVLAGLGALLVALPLYQRVRQGGLWRYELVALAAWTLTVCLFRAPVATFTILWMLTSCYLVGRFVLDKLRLAIEHSSESLSLSIAVGMGLLIYVLSVLGMVGTFYWWVFTLLFALPCALLFRHFTRLGLLLKGFHHRWAECEQLRAAPYGLLIVFAFGFVTITLFSTLTPTLVYDAKIFHLPSIRYYDAIHALQPVPFMTYSFFPQGTEVLQTAAYSLCGQYGASMISPAAFLVTLMLVYGIVRWAGDGRAEAGGSLVVAASVPFIHWTGSVLKNDLFVALFQAGALYCLVRVWKGGPENWLKLGAFLLGMGFSIKHTAVFGGVALGLLALAEIRRRPRPWRLAGMSLAILILSGTFFHVRTYALKGNPVFPKRVQQAAQPGGPVHGRGIQEGAGRIAYPWMFHFDGKQVFASSTKNPSGMFLVLCGSVWLLVRRGRLTSAEAVCWLFCGLYFLHWGRVWGILRYAILPFLLLFAFTATRFFDFLRQSGPAVRLSAQAALAYSFVFSLLVAVMIHEVSFAQLQLMTGQSSEEEFLNTVEAEYPAMAFLTGVARPEDRIIGVQNCARAHAPPLSDFLCAGLGRPEAALPRTLTALGQSDWNYLIVPNSWRQRYVDAVPDDYQLTPLHRDGAYTVLGIDSSPAP